MGRSAQILLVVAAFVAALAGCSDKADPPERRDDAAATVVASEYDSFFLWAGVEPQPALDNAKAIYILSGEIRCDEQMRFESLRAAPRLGDTADIWLVVRADCVDWDGAIIDRVLADLERWSRGNRVVGMQLDYDSPTRRLDEYASFMQQLRDRVPERYRLSVTGLLDWTSPGAGSALSTLDQSVDEIVVQTYRGVCTVPDFQEYTARLTDLPLKYRVALVQHGEWTPPKGLDADPEFLGYVVFLVNDPGDRPTNGMLAEREACARQEPLG